MRAGVDLRRGIDNRSAMKARGELPLREKQWQNPRKSNTSAGHPDQHLPVGRRKWPINNDRRGCALIRPREVSIILGERQVAGLGPIRRGEAFQFDGRVAEQFSFQAVSDVSGSERHGGQLDGLTANGIVSIRSFASTRHRLTPPVRLTIKAAKANSTPTLTIAKTLRVGMIGYGFMGKAHSNAWRQAPHFFP